MTQISRINPSNPSWYARPTAMQRNLAAGFALFLTLATACTQKADPPTSRLVQRAAPSMGTELRLSAWTADEPAALAAFAEILKEFDRLEALMSTWKEGSEIQRLNAAAG